MTLEPRINKYVKYFENIRIIQDYLCTEADKWLVGMPFIYIFYGALASGFQLTNIVAMFLIVIDLAAFSGPKG